MLWSSISALLLSAASTFSGPSLTEITSASSNACAGNTPDTRTQWCDFDVTSDYYAEAPNTGVLREYWLVLGNTTAAPDGIPRNVLTVNGTSPGPTLHASWGDWVRVHVYNGLENNGTSIHWHGVRQNHTNTQDGTNSITQCPVPPGDAGILYLNDWSHLTSNALYAFAEIYGEPAMTTGLMNGTNIWVKENNEIVGSRFNMNVTNGQSYRLRLLNAGMSYTFRFMIDDHTLTVISTDFVPIEPYNTTSLLIGVGQRYDVIVHANKAQKGPNFWMRSIPQEFCADIEEYDIRGILHYEKLDSKLATPTTTAFTYTESCEDESMTNLIPMLPVDASVFGYKSYSEVQVLRNGAGVYKWYMGPTTFVADWNTPTLLKIKNGNTSWTEESHVVQVEGNGKWVIVDIEMFMKVPHPIHLHGHDFVILAQGKGSRTSNTTLSTANPPRRDTVILPAFGYLIIAFKTDNPGAWLLHCHIGWHQSEGFDMQFVESIDQLKNMIDAKSLEDNCAAWDKYAAEKNIIDDTSGI